MAYTALFAFGDSLSDAGNDYLIDGGTDPVSPYYQGHFSNGLTWVEDLSNMLGLGTLRPSLAGGNDFAFGGAETGPTAIEGVVRANSQAVPAVLASAHEQSFPIFQQLAGGHPSGRDDVRALPAVAAQR
jgi:phospholipase/lecithinase/hemolysin